jgi:membrane protein implicated in regulation of membrane protease activity
VTQHTVQIIAGTGLLVLAVVVPYQTVPTRVGFVVLAVSVYAGWWWLQFVGWLTLLASALASLWQARTARKNGPGSKSAS